MFFSGAAGIFGGGPRPTTLKKPQYRARKVSGTQGTQEFECMVCCPMLYDIIIFYVYNLCQYYHSNKLSSFSVSMLKDMCWYFEIPYKSRDLKRAQVSELIKECD